MAKDLIEYITIEEAVNKVGKMQDCSASHARYILVAALDLGWDPVIYGINDNGLPTRFVELAEFCPLSNLQLLKIGLETADLPDDTSIVEKESCTPYTQLIDENELYDALRVVGISADKKRNNHDTTSPLEPRRHILKSKTQEEEILRILSELGYNPRELPKHPNGHKGTKSEVKERALENPGIFTKVSFNNAWQRLRNEGAIAEE